MTTKTEERIKIAIVEHGKPNVYIDLPESLSVLEDNQEIKKGQHLFRIINQQDGDKRVVWDSQDYDEIDDAQEMFNDLIEKGMVPYRVDPKGKRTPEPMVEFDPLAEEIIFAPIAAMQAG